MYNGILKELEFEEDQDRLSDPHYSCVILTKEEHFKYILTFLAPYLEDGFFNTPKNLNSIRLLDGGNVCLQDVSEFSTKDIMMNHGGREITTLFIDMSSRIWNEQSICYMFSRLRSQADCHTRAVLF